MTELLGWLIIIFAMGLILGEKFNWWKHIKNKEKLIIIKHSTVGKASYSIIYNLKKVFRIIKIINLNCLKNKDDIHTGNKEVIIETIKTQDETIKKLKKLNDEVKVAYMGITHIPLFFRLGYQFGDEKEIRLFENKKTSGEGFKELEKNSNFPLLNSSKNICKVVPDSEILIVGIGLTSELLENIPLDTENNNVLYLQVEEVKHELIKSYDQISVYKEAIIDRGIDEILRNHRNIKEIHIFFASQVTLGLTLGRAITDTQHPKKIIAYHYDYNHELKYPWGINIKESDPEKSFVRMEDVLLSYEN